METTIRRRWYIAKANTCPVEAAPNPSPTNDPWFADPQNMQSLRKGIAEMKEGKAKAYSVGEISEMLGV